MSIKILLADDHEIVRNGLRALFENDNEYEIVGEASNGYATVSLAQKLLPDVVIMDISMPNLNGIEATRQILSKAPGTKVIALSIHSHKRYVVRMFHMGASGYLPKDRAFDDLISAIKVVISGRMYLSPPLQRIFVKEYITQLTGKEHGFTRIQKVILQSLAQGKSKKQIALILNRNLKTIYRYQKQIMEKLDLRSVAELTRYAIRHGLTSLNDKNGDIISSHERDKVHFN
jgi:DNA-binding NarL/FixJ family response regulator